MQDQLASESSESDLELGPSEHDPGSEPELEGLTKEQADLYDADIDNEDEAWAVQQRNGRKSDAHLSCPSCLSTLTIDCQRHAFQPDRHRAIFVTNCRVDLSVQEPVRGGAYGKRRRGQQQPTQPAEVFHPVYCETCDAKVGVQDQDEVYHFFNCITSTA